MPMMFEHRSSASSAPRVAALDFLVALGTHSPMSDEALTRHRRPPGRQRHAPATRRIFNHRWDDPSTFVDLGHDSGARDRRPHGGPPESGRARSRSTGWSSSTEHVIICGPVFPHEVVGFSGGTKYLFPGIAAPPIIHFTHWLGALITSSDVLGTIDTPVRAVINRAASLLDDAAVAGWRSSSRTRASPASFCGDVGGSHDAWRQAAILSARRHVVWLDRAVRSRAHGDAADVRRSLDGGERRLQDRARGRRRRRGDRLRAARHARRATCTAGCSTRSAITAATTSSRSGSGSASIRAAFSRTRRTSRAAGTYDAARGLESPRISVTLATGDYPRALRSPAASATRTRRRVEPRRVVGRRPRARTASCRAPASCCSGSGTSRRHRRRHREVQHGRGRARRHGRQSRAQHREQGLPRRRLRPRSRQRRRPSSTDPPRTPQVSSVDSPPALMAALEQPRRILMMVPAGKPVDSVIAHLRPHLEPATS